MQNMMRIDEILDEMLLMIRKDSERDLPKLNSIGEKLGFVRAYVFYNNSFCDDKYFKLENELLHNLYDDDFILPYKNVRNKTITENDILKIKTDMLVLVSNDEKDFFEEMLNKISYRFGLAIKKDFQKEDVEELQLSKTDYFNIGWVAKFPSFDNLKSKLRQQNIVENLKKYNIKNAIVVISKMFYDNKNSKKYLKIIKNIIKNAKISEKIIKI